MDAPDVLTLLPGAFGAGIESNRLASSDAHHMAMILYQGCFPAPATRQVEKCLYRARDVVIWPGAFGAGTIRSRENACARAVSSRITCLPGACCAGTS